jgi:chromosome segregation protein
MLESVRQECRSLSHKKSEFEMKMGKLRSAQQDLVKRLHTLELNINDIENDITNLRDRIRDKYREDLIYFIGDFHQSSLDEKAAKREMDDVNRQVERMGAVNENASLEYEEFNKRASFLENQVGDLTDALSQLESAIKKINKTTKMRFLEAFNNINGQFSQVFPKLFNGGKAELMLSDEEDLLNCGVDIMAKPPGKNISSIELMSGGEKALTAISLIMAIFLIKPSPFCLLDEVDAPLDEANVARFSQLVKEMSELSQFIVITHNRKTMETSDQLYGVTMEEAGQSKIVSVHVQQAFESFKIQKSKASTINKATQLYLDDVLT